MVFKWLAIFNVLIIVQAQATKVEAKQTQMACSPEADGGIVACIYVYLGFGI